MIPYDDITANADRSWTFRLLDRIIVTELSDEELQAVVDSLQSVSDPRSIARLEAIVLDTSRNDSIRQAASSVLRTMKYLVHDVPDGKLRTWWREGNDVVRRHALLSMNAFRCSDVILATSSDPAHVLHAEALGRMLFGFNRVEHQELKIAALGHTDPQVRETAATILLWDEPIRAEGPLIDATRDPVPRVAAEACNTLRYYLSLRTVSCLHGLLDHPTELVRKEAQTAYEDVREEFLTGLLSQGPHIAVHVRHWLEPVWGMLAFTDDELNPDEDRTETASPPERKEAVPFADVLEMLANPDASPKVIQESLRRSDWRELAEEQRLPLRPVFLDHRDPLVREEAATVFEQWLDIDGLLALVGDNDFFVRKSAMYHLGQLSTPTRGVAKLAWEYLHRPDCFGMHSQETLTTFVRHADPTEAVRRLVLIASDRCRPEVLRTAAVGHLAKLGAMAELSHLVRLQQEPPEVTWALHITLLEAITDLKLPRPDICHLREIDNLLVQEAIGRTVE